MVADGALAQLARAPALQAGGPGFESPTLHQLLFYAVYGVNQAKVCFHSTKIPGRLAQLARASRLHREGRGFESLITHQESIKNSFMFICGRLAQLVRARH